jgi:hypothetical protein
MILANDNLVGGAIVAELPLATSVVRANGGCLAATSFICRLLAFDFFFSTPVTVVCGTKDAYDCTCGGGSSGTASAISVGGGTIDDNPFGRLLN